MSTLNIITNILAIELPSLRISPLLIRIVTIALLYPAALLVSVVYIQSIGSGIGIFSVLFDVTLISQSIETFFYNVGGFILIPWSLINSLNLCLEHVCSTEELEFLTWSLVSSSVPIKSKRLTKAEKEVFLLPEELKQILVGLLLGDLFVYKQKLGINPCLMFIQGLIHKEYLFHLYSLFESYCRMAPVISDLSPDKRTGKIYSTIHFNSYSLPCFVEFWNLFYLDGKKVVPANIVDLFTPLSLAYWICDDGSFCKRNRAIILNTQSFSLEEVNLLIKVLTDKFNLKCTVNKNRGNFVIRLSAESLPVLQVLLKDIMPPMMLHKIGL